MRASPSMHASTPLTPPLNTYSEFHCARSSHPTPQYIHPYSEFHCACFFDGQMFIFGGSTGTRRMNDTWRYKLELEPPSLQILAAHALLQQVSQSVSLCLGRSGRAFVLGGERPCGPCLRPCISACLCACPPRSTTQLTNQPTTH